jgi:predicted ATPase
MVVNLLRNSQKPLGYRVQQAELKFSHNAYWSDREKFIFVPEVIGGQLYDPGLFRPRIDTGAAASEVEAAVKFSRVLEACLNTLRTYLARQIYVIGATREPQAYKLDQPYSERVGRQGAATLAVLSRIFASPATSSEAERIRRWATMFGLKNITSGWTGEPYLSSGFNDTETNAPLRLENAGFGSRQVLPILTQICTAPPDSVIMIEEPEISLHPAAQLQLVRLFCEAVKEGQQLLITTHSQTILLGLAEAAREFGISPTEVRVYHLSHDPKMAIQEIGFNAEWVLQKWIPSFSEVETKLMHDWLQRVQGQLKNAEEN